MVMKTDSMPTAPQQVSDEELRHECRLDAEKRGYLYRLTDEELAAKKIKMGIAPQPQEQKAIKADVQPEEAAPEPKHKKKKKEVA